MYYILKLTGSIHDLSKKRKSHDHRNYPYAVTNLSKGGSIPSRFGCLSLSIFELLKLGTKAL